MSPHEKFAAVTSRLATIPSIIRTRGEDEVRAMRTAEGWDERVEARVTALEKSVAELEKAIA